MSISLTKRTVLCAGALSIVLSCCLAAFAASQTASRLDPHGNLGILLQTVGWEEPDPPFLNWEATDDVEIKYYWDWIPSTNWPEAGNPPTSWKRKTKYTALANAWNEISYVDTYGITATGETSYTAIVELEVVIRDTDTDDLYRCYAFSYTGTDAYNNLVQHTVTSSDWSITPISP